MCVVSSVPVTLAVLVNGGTEHNPCLRDPLESLGKNVVYKHLNSTGRETCYQSHPPIFIIPYFRPIEDSQKSHPKNRVFLISFRLNKYRRQCHCSKVERSRLRPRNLLQSDRNGSSRILKTSTYGNLPTTFEIYSRLSRRTLPPLRDRRDRSYHRWAPMA